MTLVQFAIALVSIALGLAVVMTFAWAIEQKTGNSGWIDTVWTFGLAAVGVVSALAPLPHESGLLWRQWLVAVMIAIWALRLGLHIAHRSSGRTDDPRYAKLRQEWGAQASWQMWLLVQKQAIVSIPMALAIFLAAHNPVPELRIQDVLALGLLGLAIGGEGRADSQLRQFMRGQPKGSSAVCDVGLWRWSRHPNYFFEWLGWLAYPLIAIDLAGGYPFGWLALGGPACMYWLLVYVSGIPPLEEHMLKTRGDAFRAYQAKTSAFFPLPPSQPHPQGERI